MNWLYDLIERWLARRRAGQHVRGDTFQIAEQYSDQGLLPIEILKGPFKGTIFVITNMEILDDYGKCRFDHKVIVKIPGKHDSFYGDRFGRVVGEILMICLEEAQSNYKALREEVLKDDEDRVDYREEPTPMRALPPEKPTIPSR